MKSSDDDVQLITTPYRPPVHELQCEESSAGRQGSEGGM